MSASGKDDDVYYRHDVAALVIQLDRVSLRSVRLHA